MIDAKKILDRVLNVRQSIEPCWSQETAYKVPEIHFYGPHRSGGQCAVTCLVLKGILEGEFPGLHCQLVSGSLETIDGEVLIRDHSWLLVQVGEDEILVDPTADQTESVHDKVIVETASGLQARGLYYRKKAVEQDYGEGEHPKRFARYQILKNAYDDRPG